MRNLVAVFSFLALLMLTGCAGEAVRQDAAIRYPIVPKPVKLDPQSGSFTLRNGTSLQVMGEGAGSVGPVRAYLYNWLQQTRGISLDDQGSGKGIRMMLDPSVEGDEAYVMDVGPGGIELKAGKPAGLFYAVQSLLQLIPPDVQGDVEVPSVHIEDAPRFGYRGLMLDVGRHFFSVEFIKEYIDILAQYKLNRFHWHLTDDQGWRIEIKRYPKLQEIAAYRPQSLVGHYNDQPQTFDGKRYGGFYTQEEVREIVAYAQERFVSVIPEIELPGHARAALAAYPELGCVDGPIEVGVLWGVHDYLFCPKEETFEFLEGVLTEVMELFPSEYIHIGGDEAPKVQWENSPVAQQVIRREGLEDEHELQSYFIQRVEKFLNAHDRKIIGWDEILQGGLAPNATVMSWQGISGGIAAARQGHDVIMSPTTHLYLDYYQSDAPDEPLAIGGYLPLEKVYSFEPVPEELTAAEGKHILGAQANLWTEYISTPEKVEYMVYPRALALAELDWTPAEDKDFTDFTKRLTVQIPRLKSLGVNAANHLYDLTTDISNNGGEGLTVQFHNPVEAGTIRYTTDGTEPGPTSKVAEGPVAVSSSGMVRAQTFSDGKANGRGTSINFDLHKGAGHAISLAQAPAPKYSAGGESAVLNGVFGNEDRYGDSEWLGFEGNDFEASIDLGTSTDLSTVDFRFFNGPGQWIYPPKTLSVEISDDGKAFRSAGSLTLDETYPDKIAAVSLPLDDSSGRYLKIVAENFGEIPAGSQGAGHEAWLFVDEIVIK